MNLDLIDAAAADTELDEILDPETLAVVSPDKPETSDEGAAIEGPTPEYADAAGEAIRSYIDLVNKGEFSYDSSVNPDGHSPEYYARRTEQARVDMIAALAVLDDDTMAEIIASNRYRDHDGSYDSVTTVIDVRQEWTSIQSAPEADSAVVTRGGGAGPEVDADETAGVFVEAGAPPQSHDVWVAPELGEPIVAEAAARRVRSHIKAVPDQMIRDPSAAGGGGYGGPVPIASVLGSLIGAPFRLAGRVIDKVSEDVAGGAANRQARRQEAGLSIVEAALADAEIASSAASRYADTLASHPAFLAFRAKMEARAQQRNEGLQDVIKEMRAGGMHADLGAEFASTVAGDATLSEQYNKFDAAMEAHQRQWRVAMETLIGSGADYQPLWERLTRVTKEIVEKTRTIPGLTGPSFAERANEFVRSIADVLRRTFRLGPATSGTQRRQATG
jgi:hypothetical protein